MPKKKVNKYKKKRNYNQMISDNINFNNDDEAQKNYKFTGTNIKNQKPKEKTGDNINLIKANKDINDFEHCPTETVIKSNENKRTDYLSIYQILIENNKEINDKNQLKLLKITENALLENSIFKDWNCLFRVISSFLIGIEQYHIYYRKLIHEYILENKDEIIIDNPYVYYNGKLINTDDYIPLIKINGNYAGELECHLITKIINFNILILRYNDDQKSLEKYYKYLNFYGGIYNTKYLPLCIMEYIESEKHYQLLYFDKNFKGNIIINDIYTNKNNCEEYCNEFDDQQNNSSLVIKEQNKKANSFITKENIEKRSLKIYYFALNYINLKANTNVTTNNISNEFKDEIKTMNELINKDQIDLSKINAIKTKEKEIHIGTDYPVCPLDPN